MHRRGGVAADRGVGATGLARRAGFTPTDALHVPGRFDRWDAEAARLGATLLAEQAGRDRSSPSARKSSAASRSRSPPSSCLRCWRMRFCRPNWEGEPTAAALLQRGVDGRSGGNGAEPSDLSYTLTLRRPLVAYCVPVAAHRPQVAAALHTEVIIPEHAEVANAVGAVSGGIVQRLQVLISPLDGKAPCGSTCPRRARSSAARTWP